MFLNICKSSRAMFLGPHTDDIEISVGGTAARLIREGCECKYVAFSDCKESIPGGFPEDALNREARSAAEALGFAIKNVHIEEFPVRHFKQYRQEILEFMVKIRREFQPDVVFAPSLYDLHQDHEVIAHEALRAFKMATVLGYEAPWNNLEARHDFFIELSEADIAKKIAAVNEFKSQGFRAYCSKNYLESLALIRGQQSGYECAEAFSVNRVKVNL